MANHKGSRAGRSTPGQAKAKVLEGLTEGLTVKQSLVKADRSYGWYELAKQQDETFRARCNMLIKKVKPLTSVAERREKAKDFATFRREYLFTETWPHQQCWIDVLEGREPSWLHPSFIYEPARQNRLLVNTPPNHSKSTTITMDYAAYRICLDPNIRILVISKTQGMAKKFLYGIKTRLTHPKYAKLQQDFAPQGGFKANADQWTNTSITFGGEDHDSGEKDPTVEALGIGGQVYGARADLVICDDCVTLSNAGEWQKQMDWLKQEVATRLGPPGKLLVVGTRVAPQDLYRELRNPEHYTDGTVPWTYFAQPAVLENDHGEPKDWVTLWPKSESPFEGAEDTDFADENGHYDRWTGPRLAEVRNDVGAGKWAMVYQQRDVAADAIFDPICVNGSVAGLRKRGPLLGHAAGHPRSPEGFYRVLSMDPAMSGDTAAVAYAVDRETHKRYVMDVEIITAPTPLRLRELIYRWTETYQPHEWVIESNAFQLFLTQDTEVTAFLATRGIPLKGHFTGRQKQDPEFGVASLQPLFGTKELKSNGTGEKHAGDNLISLPDKGTCPGVKALIEQLVVWDPEIPPKKRKCDAVMALWFAELRAREVLLHQTHKTQWFGSSQFVSQRDADSRYVVNLDELSASGNPAMVNMGIPYA